MGYFDLIFTDTFYVYLMNQINKRFDRIGNDSKPKPITLHEIKIFIAINLYMGIVKINEIKTYWNKNICLFGSSFVQEKMSYVRYTEINTNLSLATVVKSDTSEKRDIGSATKKIIIYLNNKFNEIYTPNQELSIDEGMCKYQGRYSFKTYMPAKPIKVGMKFYLLADSKTSYIMNIKLYTGKYSSIKDTVSDLLSNHTGKNYTLYMDNYYNSIALCEDLRVKQIYCCRTMRMQRGEPKDYSKERKLIRKFDFKCAQKNEINILLWYDKKVVCFVSTFMNIEEPLQKTKKVLLKPNIIKDYDQNMGGVNIFD
ncbi:PiggyBac transposable element-derived protein 4 [Cucumispora dikerogammari]|nr:PiggyBac transposable element-derived protein 4 [Cucumispora dikerogammari]